VKEFFGSILGIILSIVVVAILAVGGVWFYWQFIAPQNAAGQYNTNRNSQQFQATTIAHERSLVTGYNQSTDEGQKKAISAEFCQVYNDMTVVPSDLASAHQLLCN
jgi:hypothetical protein